MAATTQIVVLKKKKEKKESKSHSIIGPLGGQKFICMARNLVSFHFDSTLASPPPTPHPPPTFLTLLAVWTRCPESPDCHGCVPGVPIPVIAAHPAVLSASDGGSVFLGNVAREERRLRNLNRRGFVDTIFPSFP